MNTDFRNHLSKCRLCFKALKSKRKAVEITNDIKLKFLKLIGIEVSKFFIYLHLNT